MQPLRILLVQAGCASEGAARAYLAEALPPLELECLKALWSLGEASVKDVQAALVRDRKLAYTTVMTILERLARKGGVMRRKSGRAYLYSPRLSRE